MSCATAAAAVAAVNLVGEQPNQQAKLLQLTSCCVLETVNLHLLYHFPPLETVQLI